MQQSLSILRLGSEDLTALIVAEAAQNPFLQIYRPGARLTGRDLISNIALPASQSLSDIITSQISLNFKRTDQRLFAGVLAASLAPTGWFEGDLHNLAQSHSIAIDDAEDILAELQEFDPPGVFARNLSECLAIQARHEGLLTPKMSTLLQNLEYLARGRHAELRRLCQMSEAELDSAIQIIRRFDPKPGLRFSPAEPPPPPPELIVCEKSGVWTVIHNRSSVPTVRTIDFRSSGVLPSALKDLLQRARALEASVKKRSSTLLNIATLVVARQQVFLEEGQIGLIPLHMSEIAAELGLNTSTVSRAVSGCLIQTPRGTMPLSKFFSRAIKVQDTAVVSTGSIRELIRTIIQSEDVQAPLDDGKVMEKVNAFGFNVSRRTIVNYRKSLGIRTATERSKGT